MTTEPKTRIEVAREAAAEAVKRGAALLDTCMPNWVERVDILDLDVSSCQSCVLGQVYADQVTGSHPSRTGWGMGMLDLFGTTDAINGVAYGFEQRGLAVMDTLYPAEEYDLLTNAWADLIAARQG